MSRRAGGTLPARERIADAMDTTSPSLLERLRDAPDAAAWSRFVRLYTPMLLRWAYRLGLSGGDAADLVQEVFLVLLRKLPDFRYDPGQSFRAWLRTVARNRWLDLSARQREKVVAPEDPAFAGLAAADPAEL